MSIYNNKKCAVFLTASITVMGVVSAPGFADTHIVRVNANAVITYNSAMSSYRPLESEKSDWKQSNDTVGKIGGWRTYANEAYQANKRMSEPQMSGIETVESGVVDGKESVATASAVPVPDLTMAKPIGGEMMETKEPLTRESHSQKPIVGLSHQSATNLHRNYREITLQDWKAANNRVGEIGGWRTYAKEAYEANKRMTEEAGAKK